MRVLFATIPEKSHLYCLTPIAWAVRAAGHEVRIASCSEFADVIARTGMTAVATGTGSEITGAMSASEDSQDRDAIDFSELDPSKLTWQGELHRAQLFAYGCAMYNEPMIDEMVDFARAWQPDLVVWDPLTFAGPIAAGAVGAAHVRSLCFADVWTMKRQLFRKLHDEAPESEQRDPMRAWLDGRSSEFGGSFSEEFLTGQLTLDPLPESLGLATDARRAPVRVVPYNGPAVVPEWLHESPRRPRICMTLGAANAERDGRDHISKGGTLEALAELDAEVVAALLPAQVRELGPLPENVRVVESVPLHALLPSCSLLIHHGGFGSYTNALVQGVPQLMATTPIADLHYRGVALERQGAGLVLEHHQATPDAIRERAARMLTEPAFKKNADRLRDEALARPAPAEAVAELERVAVERRTAAWTR